MPQGVVLGGFKGNAIGYGAPPSGTCDLIQGNGSVSNPVKLTPPLGWPITPPTPPADPTCTTTIGGASTTFSLTTYPTPGVYCLSGTTATLTIPNAPAGKSYSGYSFEAPKITVTAVSNTFSPATGETVVFDATAPTSDGSTLSISGAGNSITGAMCFGAQTGTVTLAPGSTHPAGTYCVTGTTGTLTPGGGNGTGWSGFTWFAPIISANSHSQTFSNATNLLAPFRTATVFDAYQGNLTLNGNSNTTTGNLFAPNGQASVAGGGVGAGSGFMEAQTLSFSGNFSTYHGTGGFGGGPVTVPVGTSTSYSTSTSTSTSTTPPSTSTDQNTTIITPGYTQTVTTGTTVGLAG